MMKWTIKIYTYLSTGGNYVVLYYNGNSSSIIGTYNVGDKFKVERLNGVINYYQNDILKQSYPETNPGAPMRIDFALLRPGTACHNIKLVKYDQSQVENDRFSYTYYDALGRIKEGGEIVTPFNRYEITEEGRLNKTGVGYVNSFIDSYPKNQVTKTFYDNTIELPQASFTDVTSSDQLFSNYNHLTARNRVTGILYYDKISSGTKPPIFDNGIFYNYDIHGSKMIIITKQLV